MQALIAGSLKISKSPRRRTDSHSQRHDGYPVNFHGLLVNLKCQETNGAGRKLRLLCKYEKNSREIGYPSDRITKSSARFSEVKPFRQIGDDGDLQPTKYAHSQELSRSIFNSGRLFGCGQRARERETKHSQCEERRVLLTVSILVIWEECCPVYTDGRSDIFVRENDGYAASLNLDSDLVIFES